MSFKLMRDWLIDGNHKMFKIPVTTDEEKKNIEAWLIRNNLPKYDNYTDDNS